VRIKVAGTPFFEESISEFVLEKAWQVSQDRPVYNEEKGEKISANAFLLDVEDVEELDDAKVVALASAEAWDAETEEPISIKTVEYDIKPETGNYTVTFATANDTSITVKVLVVAQNRVESKVYQEEIYAMNFFKKDSGFSKTGVPENQISLTSFLSTLITTIAITNAIVLFMPLSLCFLNYLF
jgi:hypothetical protein